MEIISPPATETIRVIDLDFRFPGETYSATLYSDDTLTVTDQEIRIVFAKANEEVIIERAHVLLRSRRERTITRPVPPAPTPK